MSVNIKCVDLFCGCGGMSLGFQKAGFNIVAGIDNWKSAIRVYGMNFNHPIIEQDLLDVDEAVKIIAAYAPAPSTPLDAPSPIGLRQRQLPGPFHVSSASQTEVLCTTEYL